MVFAVHFGQRINLTGIVRDLTDFGAQGVSLFFLISGFLAGKAFYNNPQINIAEYYKKRAVAILPLYYLVILYYFISENILNHFNNFIPQDNLGVYWLRYIFILNGFLNSDTYFWSNLGITWTIPIFCFFYLISPWLLRKTKSVFSVVSVWLAVFFVSKLLNHFYECTIFSNIHILFLGVVIYACVNKRIHLQATIIFVIFGIFSAIIDEKDYLYISLFASLILTSSVIDTVKLPSWLQNTINTLDNYSYTLYLMHGVVFCSLIDRLNTIQVPKLIIAVCSVAISLMLTWIVGRFIEKPIQKKLKEKFINNKTDTP